MDINKLLSGVKCSCGKFHECDIKYVYVENNAIAHLEELCSDFGKILVVADENTYGVAGERVEKYISSKIADRQIFTGSEILIPNEDAISAVEKKLDGIDLIVGIGSGVIQDLCKYVSFYDKIPYYIVATAPSMDGYASNGAAMITGGMKVTYSCKLPTAIIADTAVLKDAPIEMIKSGYGDIIGKYSALNDWKLANIVYGEYLCDYIYDLTDGMVKKTLPLAKSLLERDEESIKTLTEALMVVGIAMSFAGSSRPASGSEHHFSHFFEITGIVDGTDYLPHGIDVAFSTIYTSKIRDKIKNSKFPEKQFVMDRDVYKSEMNRVYKTVAASCIALQDKVGRYNEDRIGIYLANEDKIKAVLAEVPSADEITKILSDVGLDTKTFFDTYSPAKLQDAVHYAKELKDRYTVLWMYYDMFGIEEL